MSRLKQVWGFNSITMDNNELTKYEIFMVKIMHDASYNEEVVYAALAKMLNNREHVEEVELSFYDENYEMDSALIENSLVKILDLIGLEKIASINLQNQIINENIKNHIVNILKQPDNLLDTLTLDSSKITEMHLQEILDAIKNEHSNIRILSLAHQNLSSDQIDSLYKILESDNNKITHLDIANCKLDSKSLERLAKSFYHPNCKIITLTLGDSNLDKDWQEAIEPALSNIDCKINLIKTSFDETREEGSHANKVIIDRFESAIIKDKIFLGIV